VQAEGVALRFRKGGSFVEPRIQQQVEPRQADFESRLVFAFSGGVSAAHGFVSWTKQPVVEVEF